MDVGSISSVSSVNSYTSTAKTADTTEKSTYGKDAAAIYEQSNDVKSASSNKALVAKLKADAENRVSQMRSLVADMLSKQGVAIKTADDMWKALASGNFTVDAATAKEAQDAISEDGYWGVNQTSQRIFDFAVALSGGDSEQMDKLLRKVFLKLLSLGVNHYLTFQAELMMLFLKNLKLTKMAKLQKKSSSLRLI